MPTIEANGFDALCKTTKRHAAALFFGEIADLIWKGSGRYIQAQGTITFIRYRNRCFGVTNDHVYHAPSSKVVPGIWHSIPISHLSSNHSSLLLKTILIFLLTSLYLS